MRLRALHVHVRLQDAAPGMLMISVGRRAQTRSDRNRYRPSPRRHRLPKHEATATGRRDHGRRAPGPNAPSLADRRRSPKDRAAVKVSRPGEVGADMQMHHARPRKAPRTELDERSSWGWPRRQRRANSRCCRPHRPLSPRSRHPAPARARAASAIPRSSRRRPWD